MALVAYADGPDSPRSDPWSVAAAVGAECGAVLLGWTPEDRPWLADPRLAGWAVMAGYALAAPIADGRLAYLPVRLSAVPRLLGGDLRPDVAVVTGVRRGDRLVYGSSVGWAPALAEKAATLVVEVDEEGPDLGGPVIEGRVAATLARPPGRPDAPGARAPDDAERRLGRHVASAIPDGATIQVGPGAVADAIVASLDRPVKVASGLVTDSVAALAGRGLLDGAARTAYAWGGDPLADLARRGALELLPIEVTHDLSRLSATDRFVACNTAVQVGLDGSVNVELAAGRRISGIGGHADFCTAAARSDGGLSIVALRSSTRSGASTIVPAVSTVSTPRCDVDLVVTEHGVADLRTGDDAERARRIAAVAAPEHREALLAAAAGM